MGFFKKKTVIKTYDKENKKPVIKASICNGEQVAGFKDIHTGKIDSSIHTVSFGLSTRKLPVPADTAFSKISMLRNGIILAVCFSYIPDAWSRLI